MKENHSRAHILLIELERSSVRTSARDNERKKEGAVYSYSYGRRILSVIRETQ